MNMNGFAQKVYLDWAATTPLYTECAEAMMRYLTPGVDALAHTANANSLHSYGRQAFSDLEDARKRIARNLGARRSSEIIFTSGATEANNAAIFGIEAAIQKNARQKGISDFVPHIITSAIEHDAVLAPFRRLFAQGIEVSYLKPDKQGFISLDELKEALQPNTVFVSLQLANNEIGSIQPIAQLCKIAHEASAYFHTDAVQALGKIPINLDELGVDAASFSAHKIGGPKGVGVLYLKHKTPFEPLLVGGGQEGGKRSGTQNVGGAVGFAAACDISTELQAQEKTRLQELRNYLYAELCAHEKISPTAQAIKSDDAFLPHIVNVLVDGFESETLILRLDSLGYEVSGGSACSSHSLEPSHVITALGYSKDKAQGSLRISLGRYTTKKDIDGFVDAVRTCISGS